MINNRERMRQIIDFRGLHFDTKQPTDIDGFIDFDNKLFIIFELKCAGVKVPPGQRLALQRLAQTTQSKNTRCIIAEHDTPISEDVDAASAIVVEVYREGCWRPVENKITLRRAIDGIRRKEGEEPLSREEGNILFGEIKGQLEEQEPDDRQGEFPIF